MSLTLSLPWPGITVNHLYRRGASGQTYLHPVAQAWGDAVIIQARQSGQTLPSGPLAFWAWVIPPDKRRRDLDNLLKLAGDSIFAAFGRDDYDVTELHVFRCQHSRERAQIAVMLAPCAPALTVEEMQAAVGVRQGE